MRHEAKKRTGVLYGRLDDIRSDRVWHIFPPDPTNPGTVNDASWCGRYMIGMRQVTTIPSGTSHTCRVCMNQSAKMKLRNPAI